MSKSTPRYFVYSVKSGSYRSLKNAETREEARNYKRQQTNPSNFAIFDRHSDTSIR